jgi:hypothetical protein
MKVLDYIPHGLELGKSGFQLQKQLIVEDPGTSRHLKQATLSNVHCEE